MKFFQSFKYLLVIVCLCQNTFAADIAGRVIMARGDVHAISDNGESRKLKRRDSIFSHEIIKTGSASRIQIRFIDNALLALKENSELNIKAYVYNEANEKDNQVLMELVTGGFRTLTGKIGKGNKEAYKVDTPVASIGIRGTLYDVQIAVDKIYAGVWKGGIALNTEQGDFDLGMNANFDFAEISSSGDFTGLLVPPEALTSPSATGQNDDDSEGKQGFDSDNTQEDSSENEDTSGTSSDPGLALGDGDNKNIPSPFDKDTAPDQNIVQDSDSFTQDTIEEGESLQDADDLLLPTEGYSPDIRLSPEEFTQLASNPKVAFLIGNGAQDIGVSLNTDGTGDSFFLSPTVLADGTSGYETIRRASASEKDFSNIIPWSDQVSWGIWQGTEATPIERYTRFDNDQFFEPLASDLFYMEFSPASTLEMSNGLTEGLFTFSTSSASLIGTGQTDFIASASNGGQITHLAAQFDLSVSSRSYSLNNIYLDIEVDIDNDMSADQTWNVSAANGQVDSSNITIDTLQGFLTDVQTEQQIQVNGTLNGFLLSPKAGTTVIDTFAGGFELSTIDGVEHVGGVIILQSGQVIPQ
ncbi:hypothetical protein A9R00_10990 [Oleispira antarctica]|uniref:FecR protein domain-containing protein n=1 Tax=Oleispira antarctica TaxID=188908 RepID=A0A1Y5HS19_OLEAN|nr:hypothetical protein A9R00_10990 [Oleispira antarctica]